MTELILRPVVMPHHLIGHPAPCDFFDAKGTLLLKMGSPISMGAAQRCKFFCEADQADHISPGNPVAQLHKVGKTLSHLAERTSCGEPVSSVEFVNLASELFDLWSLDADFCIGYVRLVRFDRPSVCHAILASLFTAELAVPNCLPRDSIVDVIGSALTMNLATMALHDEMFSFGSLPSKEKRDEIETHPTEGAKLLERIGGFPQEWISAVAQHHENVDGSGYPLGLKHADIALSARMLRIADTLAARLTGRKKRAPRRWNINQSRDAQRLTQHVFGSDLERLDKILVRQLMARLGAFSPGSLVRLSSRELAVVSRRQSDPKSMPTAVQVFLDTYGRTLETPRLRQISTRGCTIHSYVHDELPRLPSCNWQRAWGYL